jgi:hypothetical protein
MEEWKNLVSSYELRVNSFRLAPFDGHRLEATPYDLRLTIYC